MSITRYGLGLIIGSWLLFLTFLIISLAFGQPLVIIFAIITGMFSVFNMFFFRDPERKIPDDPNAIVSPADGKVIQITEVHEHDFFKEKVSRLSIFLSVFDVHVNRVPIAGKVEHFWYQRGRFIPAFRESASVENEQTIIGIQDAGGRKVLYKQIAGIIARRIVCELREGNKVETGEKMGMIRYGSRVDLFFHPDSVELKVQKGQKVKGGSSIIGVFK